MFTFTIDSKGSIDVCLEQLGTTLLKETDLFVDGPFCSCWKNAMEASPVHVLEEQPSENERKVDEEGMWFSFGLVALGVSFFVPGHLELDNGIDPRPELYKRICLIVTGTVLCLYGMLDVWIGKGMSNKFRFCSKGEGNNSASSDRVIRKIDTLIIVAFYVLVGILVMWSTIDVYNALFITGAPFRFRPYATGPATSKYALAGTLPSGLKYVISKVRSYPRGFFSAALKVDVGSSSETEKERGIAHFAEHMAFDASRKSLHRYGVWLSLDANGVEANAFTTHRTTVYEVNNARSEGDFHDGMSSTADDVSTGALQVMVDQFLLGNSVDKHVNIEKGAVIGENRMRNTTLAWVEHQTMCQFFGSKSLPCARAPQGTDATVAAFSSKDVDSFRKKWYVPKRSTLYVAGDYEASDMEAVVKKVWGDGSLDIKSGGAPLPKVSSGAQMGVFGQGEKRIGEKAKAFRNIEISGNHKGINGVHFNFIMADPVNGDYVDNEPKTNLERLRSIHSGLFRYVLSHMVYEGVEEMVQEAGTDPPEVDFDANFEDNYQYGARAHEMRLKVGMGFGGEKAAEEVHFRNSRDGSWRTLLFTALLEVRRLALYGPNPVLLNEAMDAYFEKIQNEAVDLSRKKSGTEIVEDLYGDLSPNHIYYHQTEIFRMEKPMMSQGMSVHAANFIKAEASLVWKSWINTFRLNVTNGEEKAWLEKIQTSPRTLLRVSYSKESASDTEFAISKDSLLLLSRQVLMSTVQPPEAPKGHAKSDSIFKKKDEEDNLRAKLKRSYVRHRPELEAAAGELRKIPSDKTKRTAQPAFAPSSASGGSHKDKKKSDGIPAGRSAQLLDYARLQERVNALQKKFEKANPKAMKEIEKFGALPVKQEPNSGIRIYNLFNGIGVNIKPFASGNMRVPIVGNGTVVVEIVSLGGRATESPAAKGACDVAAMGLEDFVAAEYDSTGELRVDKEIFPMKIFQRASNIRSSEDAKPIERVGLPGPPAPPQMLCDREFLRIKATLSSACVKSGPDAPEVPCDTSALNHEEMLGILSDMRLKMMPMYNTRSIRRAYSNVLSAKMEEKRESNPRQVIKTAAVNNILKARFPSDHRMRRVEPSDIRSLNPETLSRWVREQFDPDRIEINVVGDIDVKIILEPLQLIFGTLIKRPANSKRVGYDVYSEADVQHFTRAWGSSDSKTGCHLIDDNVERAFPMLMVPAQDGISFRGGEMRQIVTAMIEKQLWRNLRMDEGLTYFVGKHAFHSVLFPGFGYRTVDWGSGKYNARDPASDPLNVEFSVSKAKDALGKDRIIAKDMFQIVMKSIEGHYKTHLQNIEEWFGILRGMSLKLPKAFESNGLKEPTLKDIDEGAVMEGLKAVTYQKYKQWMDSHVPDKSSQTAVFVVETMDKKENAKYEMTKSIDCMA
jgi:predicted Zn-dependent peptidase